MRNRDKFEALKKKILVRTARGLSDCTKLDVNTSLLKLNKEIWSMTLHQPFQLPAPLLSSASEVKCLVSRSLCSGPKGIVTPEVKRIPSRRMTLLAKRHPLSAVVPNPVSMRKNSSGENETSLATHRDREIPSKLSTRKKPVECGPLDTPADPQIALRPHFGERFL